MTPVDPHKSGSKWRVSWISFGGETRVRVFTSEDDAREWLEYCTTGWGADATAELAQRAVGPWDAEPRIGPRSLDHGNARHI